MKWKTLAAADPGETCDGLPTRIDVNECTRRSTNRLPTLTNKVRFHMPDGQAQRERDAEMAGGATDWSWAAIAWLYEHDAKVVEDHHW